MLDKTSANQPLYNKNHTKIDNITQQCNRQLLRFECDKEVSHSKLCTCLLHCCVILFLYKFYLKQQLAN